MRIPPGVTESELSIHVMKVFNLYKADTKRRFNELSTKSIKGIKNIDAFRAEYRALLKETNQLITAELATYVIDRKAALDALECSIQHDKDGAFPLEDAVHQIIFPLKATSDDISYDDSNLWIIDERLAFHSYLASDTAFETHTPLESDSAKRPDLAMYYDSAFAFGDQKEPMDDHRTVFFS